LSRRERFCNQPKRSNASDRAQRRERKALGVSDDLAAIPGLTTAMLVALGEKSIRSVEDLADCATDDLMGWNERKDKETIHHEGVLDDFTLSRPDVEDMRAPELQW